MNRTKANTPCRIEQRRGRRERGRGGGGGTMKEGAAWGAPRLCGVTAHTPNHREAQALCSCRSLRRVQWPAAAGTTRPVPTHHPAGRQAQHLGLLLARSHDGLGEGHLPRAGLEHGDACAQRAVRLASEGAGCRDCGQRLTRGAKFLGSSSSTPRSKGKSARTHRHAARTEARLQARK